MPSWGLLKSLPGFKGSPLDSESPAGLKLSTQVRTRHRVMYGENLRWRAGVFFLGLLERNRWWLNTDNRLRHSPSQSRHYPYRRRGNRVQNICLICERATCLAKSTMLPSARGAISPHDHEGRADQHRTTSPQRLSVHPITHIQQVYAVCLQLAFIDPGASGTTYFSACQQANGLWLCVPSHGGHSGNCISPLQQAVSNAHAPPSWG